MITKVRIEKFKKFEDEVFELQDGIVLAGPNNAGKTTLLQAISCWNLGVQRWIMGHNEDSKAKQRTGVPISRKDFTAIPLREMDLLWTERDTAYSKNEAEGKEPGQPKLVTITVWWQDRKQEKERALQVQFRYTNKEQAYVKLTDEKGKLLTAIPEGVDELNVVHIPPFSGIGAEETGLKPGYQNMLIGQGKPGDVLRNLILAVHQNSLDGKNKAWQAFVGIVKQLFGYELLEPQYAEITDPFIRINYKPENSRIAYDLASAGSGFHQVLTILGFFYSRPASVLLLDEPDAHLHMILQREVYDILRSLARERSCQLIISTHSEVLLEDTGAEQILSFYGRPHRLQVEAPRDQVREALKLLNSMEILAAENRQNILYVENESDHKILREWARILDHQKMRGYFETPFIHCIHGRNIREAKDHFFGLQAVNNAISGVLLLDGDNRNLPEREIRADNLLILRWRRYEIENYLIHPEVLLRFIVGNKPDLISEIRRTQGEEFLAANMPPASYKNPLQDSDYLLATAASKNLLPQFFEAAHIQLSKKDYFKVAAIMTRNEIHDEVREKLDAMAARLL